MKGEGCTLPQSCQHQKKNQKCRHTCACCRRRMPCTCHQQWDMCSGRGEYNPPRLLPVVSTPIKKTKRCRHTCAHCPYLHVTIVVVVSRQQHPYVGYVQWKGEPGCTLLFAASRVNKEKKKQEEGAHLCIGNGTGTATRVGTATGFPRVWVQVARVVPQQNLYPSHGYRGFDGSSNSA